MGGRQLAAGVQRLRTMLSLRKGMPTATSTTLQPPLQALPCSASPAVPTFMKASSMPIFLEEQGTCTATVSRTCSSVCSAPRGRAQRSAREALTHTYGAELRASKDRERSPPPYLLKLQLVQQEVADELHGLVQRKPDKEGKGGREQDTQVLSGPWSTAALSAWHCCRQAMQEAHTGVLAAAPPARCLPT